jgi:LPXTG-motif cell wall-anchored protein
MEPDLLSGDGSLAAELNFSGAGDNYVANQSPLDVIDNGQVTQNNGTTTVAPPSWLSSLTGIFGAAAPVVGQVATLTGKTTAPAAKVATPGAGSPASSLLSGNTLYIILGAAALVLGAFLFFKRR